MAAVEHLYAAPRAESKALRRIRLLSLPFEILFAALTAVMVATYAVVILAGLFYEGENFRLTQSGPTVFLGDDRYPADSIRVADVLLAARLVGLVLVTAIHGSLIAALFSLHKLFGCYRRGAVFAQAPIQWMRRAGFFLIAFGLAPALVQPVVQAAGLMDRDWLHGHSIAAVLVGGALFVLAYVIALGRELEQEGEGYV
jgi:hypothetical protein